jgi:hypothetical protein
MVSILQLTTFVTLVRDRVVGRRDWARATLGLLGVVAIAIAEGYGSVFTGNASMRAYGFGHYSWNLATTFVPPEAYWGWPHGVVRDATGGQYEGDAYVGLGTVLVVVACVLMRPARVVAAVRRHWIFCVVLVAYALYAASNRVFVGSYLVADVPLPERLLGLTSFFRASARFIWIPIYALALFSLAALIQWTPRRVAIPVIVLAVVVQLRESTFSMASLRPVLEQPAPRLIAVAQMRGWMQQHRRLFQFPSWFCGRLSPNEEWGSPEATRELHLQLMAARAGLPTNSVYTSRQLKDCAAEARWADRPVLEDGVLYLLNKTTAASSPRLAELAASTSCLDVGWGLVCSRQPLQTPVLSGRGP